LEYTDFVSNLHSAQESIAEVLEENGVFEYQIFHDVEKVAVSGVW